MNLFITTIPSISLKLVAKCRKHSKLCKEEINYSERIKLHCLWGNIRISEHQIVSGQPKDPSTCFLFFLVICLSLGRLAVAELFSLVKIRDSDVSEIFMRPEKLLGCAKLSIPNYIKAWGFFVFRVLILLCSFWVNLELIKLFVTSFFQFVGDLNWGCLFTFK